MTRTVLITGGSSGLGLEVARRVVARGDAVVLLARDQLGLERAREELGAQADVTLVSADVSDPEALSRLPPVDALVACAGIMREGRFEEIDPEQWRLVLETNLFGTVNTVRAALPALHRAPDGGAIVIVASVAGLLGVYGYTAYSASKHALIGFADSLRYELDDISVSVVCPGEFESPLVSAMEHTRTPQNRAHVLMIPRTEIGAVADCVDRVLRRPRARAIPGLRARTMARVATAFPTLTRLLAEQRIHRARS